MKNERLTSRKLREYNAPKRRESGIAFEVAAGSGNYNRRRSPKAVFFYISKFARRDATGECSRCVKPPDSRRALTRSSLAHTLELNPLALLRRVSHRCTPFPSLCSPLLSSPSRSTTYPPFHLCKPSTFAKYGYHQSYEWERITIFYGLLKTTPSTIPDIFPDICFRCFQMVTTPALSKGRNSIFSSITSKSKYSLIC